jgi:chaperonin cofactor prefoldin
MDNEQFQEFVVKHLMKLDTNVSELKTDVSSLKTKVSSLEKTVIRIETRMEHEIINKIQVLFDGHQVHEDRFDRIEKKLGIN